MIVKNWLNYIINIGQSSDDSEELKAQKSFLLYLAVFMSLGGLIWGTISLAYGLLIQSTIPYGYILISFLNILYFKKTKNFKVVRSVQVLISLILPFLFQWSLGGFLPSGIIMLWAVLSLIASLSFQEVRTTFIWLALFVSLTIFSGLIDEYLNEHAKPENLSDVSLPFIVLNITVIISTVFVLVVYFVHNLKSTKLILKSKQHEIEEKNEQLQRANNAKSQFLATISHEIRTPLNGIIGISEILKETPLSNEQKKLINSLQKSNTILHSLINDVLDLTQIEENKIILNNSNFNLHKEIMSLLEISKIQTTEQKPDVEILMEIDDDIPQTIKCDLVRLKQIILNLINNAIKFTQAGHIKLKVYHQKSNGDHIVLNFEIEDTGIGITEENQKRLFDKFFRIKEVNVEGTGLGLIIAKNLIEKMGGQINFTSSHGKGTTFFFQILAEKGDITQYVTNQSGMTENQSGSLSILVAEDNEINRIVCRKMLKNLGYQDISFAKTGIEAIEKVKKKSFDLIFMDINMPEMNGVEATKNIFDHCTEQSKKAPVIGALTANALKHEQEEYMNAGMSFILNKPFTKSELTKAISIALAGTASNFQK